MGQMSTAKKSPPRQAVRATPSSQVDAFPTEAARAIQELATKLRGKTIARRVWEEMLSPHEHTQLPLQEFLASHPVDTFARMRRVPRERAVLDMSLELEFLSEQQYRRLLRQLHLADRNRLDGPVWNADRLELMLRGQVVRRLRYRGRARNVVRILDTFQELEWPDRIDDPLPGGADSERLRDTIKSLNRGLIGLRFRADGTGYGIVWELV
jgi:hypothetical protein